MRICGANTICFLWYLTDDGASLRETVVFYVIQTGFDNSMKHIGLILENSACHSLLSPSSVSQQVTNPAAALNIKKTHFLTTRETALLSIVAPDPSVQNQTFLLMNVAAGSAALIFFFFKEDQCCRAFQCVGREEEECMNPTTTSSLPRPFITQPAEEKGNWKVCSGNSADRRQTTCRGSRSCFVGQLICSSRLHEPLCLPAMISELYLQLNGNCKKSNC